MGWRRFLRRATWDDERARELESYVQIESDQNIARGMPAAEARRAAQRKLGNQTHIREQIFDLNTIGSLDNFGRDVRDGLRALRRSPTFTGAAVVMLAIGMGANAAIFSVVNSVIIKPLPYPDSEALVRIVHNIGGVDQPWFSEAIYLSYTNTGQAFQDVGIWSTGAAAVTGLGDPEEVRTLSVNRGFLSALAVSPHMGRWFSPEEDTPGAPLTAIISHGYWERKFGADRRVLERTVTIDSRAHQIVGVMPAAFRFGGEHDIILPARVNRARPGAVFGVEGLARLKPGVTLASANADVTRILESWFEKTGANKNRTERWTPALRPLKQDVVGDVGTSLWVLMGTIGIVLLMACTNVANLLLVRAEARHQEFAIRAALGAHWTRIARSLLVESVALALMSGALGVAVAHIGLRLLVAIGPADLPRLSEVAIDPLVLLVALTVSLASGILFGLVPVARYASRQVIHTGDRGASLSPDRLRAQNLLVAVQVALALVTLVSSGLMIRSFQALRSVEPGFIEPGGVQTFTFSIPRSEVAEPERVTQLQQQIVDAIADLPGVDSVALTTRLPMDLDDADRFSSAITAEDKPEQRPTPPNRHVRFVSPGSFQTLGTALLAGRDFSWTDIYERRAVAIISENLAREFWGSPAEALGKRIREFYSKSPWREIVGVVDDVHDDGAHKLPPATVYWPTQETERSFGLAGYQPRRVAAVIRTDRAGTESLLSEVGDAVRSVRASLPLAEMRTLAAVYDESMARTSFTLVMLAIAAAMALGLGLFGVYAVIAYAVSRRRREIGIRLALGAQAREIRRLFVRRALTVAAIGVVLGLAVAAGLTRLMGSLLFGVSPLDPLTFAAVPVVLAAAVAAASYLPARSASAVSPVEVLATSD